MFLMPDTDQYVCSAAVKSKGLSPVLVTQNSVSRESAPSDTVYLQLKACGHISMV